MLSCLARAALRRRMRVGQWAVGGGRSGTAEQRLQRRARPPAATSPATTRATQRRRSRRRRQRSKKKTASQQEQRLRAGGTPQRPLRSVAGSATAQNRLHRRMAAEAAEKRLGACKREREEERQCRLHMSTTVTDVGREGGHAW